MRHRWPYFVAAPVLGMLLGAYVQPFHGSGTGHSAGLVPDPGATAGTTRYLCESGGFAVPYGGWQVATVTTAANGQATWTFPAAFTAAPVVTAVAVVPSGGSANSYNVQVVSVSATALTVQVNATSGTAVSLLGLTSLTLFAPAPSGVVVHVAARAP